MTAQPEFREPLHQPPDPLDLLQFPPATPKCASVRGRLRDFADGDLGADERAEVEEHVHGCRTCAVALARAEHEVLRLRRAFGAIDRTEVEAGRALRDDFAARVVQRLVLDETSLLSRDALAKAAAASMAGAGDRQAGSDWQAGSDQQAGSGRQAGSEPPRVRGAAGFFVGAAVLLVVLVVGAGLRFGADQQPERSARLTITQAADARGDEGPLGRGDGLGEDQTLWVGARGRARADWHDATARSQPAATLQVTNNGQVRVQDGEPLLVQGNLLVETRRPVTIPVADGSRLDLGVGEYLISAEGPGGLGRNQRNPLAGGPATLRVSIEVLSGDAAFVQREAVGSTLVAQGNIGIYEGDSPVDLRTGANSGGGETGWSPGRQDPVVEPDPHMVSLRGRVLDRAGGAAIGANVHMSYSGGGVPRSGIAVAGTSGWFDLPTGAFGSGAACDSPFAILTVLPPAHRSELGVTVPEAFRVGYGDGNATLTGSLVLDASWPLQGTVRDDFGNPRSGVRVLPCVVDEVFPCVLVMPNGQVVTGATGDFRLPGLPVVLPHHQHLAVLLVHADLEPTVVRVAPRSSIAARLAPEPFVAARLRTIRLHKLPGGSTVQLLEEIKGLPPGAAVVRRLATPDAEGEVDQFRVGTGALWARFEHPATSMVQAMGLVDLQGVPLYEPTGTLRPYHSQFRPVEALTGSDVCVDNAYRFELFAANGPGSQLNTTVTTYDSLSSRTIAGAQVFAVGPGGPRGSASTRFLGFSSSAGQLRVELLRGETGVVAIGADGAVGIGGTPTVGGQIAVPVQDCGRVLLDESLRPSPASNRQFVAIQLERADPWVAGLQPVVVRFASASEGWIVTGVPPGEYRATVDGVHRSLVVTNGLVVLY